MTKHSGVKTSLEVLAKRMNNVIKFPSKDPIVNSEVDKQFLELEKQKQLIEEQRKTIEELEK